jgi:uncharacterized surface protein with fasciclin (FAS1) repeats
MRFSVLAYVACVISKTALDVVLESPIHKTLASLAGSLPDIVDVLKSAGPLTLFAPTDAAFAKLDAATVKAVTSDAELLRSVLKYHVVAGTAFVPDEKTASRQVITTAVGKELRVDVSLPKVTLAFGLGTSSVTASAKTDNGIVHVVDTVLLSPKSASATAVDAKLTKLVAALQKTKLVSTVDGLKGVTIFAPVDAAFEALEKVSSQIGLSLTDALLTTVLKTHIIPSVVYSTDIVAKKLIRDVKTVSGNTLDVSFRRNNVFVRGNGNFFPAKVVVADVLIDGGVVHIIDNVLLPSLAH